MLKSIRYINVFQVIRMKKIEFYNNKNIISVRLRQARKESRLSQSELAARLQLMNINIDQQMISKIEKNERQVTDYELACLCKCLNISVEWMLQDFLKIAEDCD